MFSTSSRSLRSFAWNEKKECLSEVSDEITKVLRVPEVFLASEWASHANLRFWNCRSSSSRPSRWEPSLNSLRHHVAFLILRPVEWNSHEEFEPRWMLKSHLSIHFHLPQFEIISHRIFARVAERGIHHRRYGILLHVKQVVRWCRWIMMLIIVVIHFRYSRIEIDSANERRWTSNSSFHYNSKLP